MEKTNTNVEISRLLEYGLQRGLIAPEDKAYAANRMLALLGLREFEPQPVEEELHTPVEPLERLCQFAAEAGLIEPDTRDGRDQFDTELMNCLMPRPSQVVREFYSLYEKDKQAATDYYYQLARSSNYIRVDRIEKDRMWTAPTPYGDLVITINLSKPEKDPKAIAAAKNAPQSGYPKCALCRENEGYLGSANQAARGNHRLIPLELGGEPWFLQYSPYVYYNEHCIVLSHEHRPMKVSRQSISRLLEFVTFLPHYFVGSNADLPIVGGSILTHDHFQGGRYEFPMAKAPIREKVCFPGFEDVEAGIVHWPMSVIRLRGKEAQRLVDLADKILTAWREYSDESAEILAYTEGTPHNTITPHRPPPWGGLRAGFGAAQQPHHPGAPPGAVPPPCRVPSHQKGEHRPDRGDGPGHFAAPAAHRDRAAGAGLEGPRPGPGNHGPAGDGEAPVLVRGIEGRWRREGRHPAGHPREHRRYLREDFGQRRRL